MTPRKEKALQEKTAPSRGRFINTGNGPTFQVVDIGHEKFAAVIELESAFWSLVAKKKLPEVLLGGEFLKAYAKKAGRFRSEMENLRFGLTPSAVYFNPTERCNMDCVYCYIPAGMRREGAHMPEKKLLKALSLLKDHFRRTMPAGRKPQIIFHGAEPLLNRDAVFAGIEAYGKDFLFGIQTNGVLLDEAAVAFLADKKVSIGLSLDAPTARIADRTRKNWEGRGIFGSVVAAMDRLRGYDGWSVICTVTAENLPHLTKLVEFFHEREVPTCLMNILRCTLPRAREIKPGDVRAAASFLAALDRTYELYRETGRRLPVANFANILLAIIAPTARRLMCDISPCGGGRCFFALATNGDLFPCSEFIGLESFRGGNLFTDDIPAVIAGEPFRRVTGRKVEEIEPCRRCAIRHFCGSPCPAEAQEMNGGMDKTGAFCEFYEEQVRYAFRVIADGKVDAFLWEGWDKGVRDTFSFTA